MKACGMQKMNHSKPSAAFSVLVLGYPLPLWTQGMSCLQGTAYCYVCAWISQKEHSYTFNYFYTDIQRRYDFFILPVINFVSSPSSVHRVEGRNHILGPFCGMYCVLPKSYIEAVTPMRLYLEIELVRR